MSFSHQIFLRLFFICIGVTYYRYLRTNLSTAFIAKLTKSIALISVSVPNEAKGGSPEWLYVFYTVTSVLAWERIGFQTVLLFVIDYNKIQSNAINLVRHVIITALEWKARVVYLDVSSHFKVRTSQVIRIYAASLLEQLDPHDYLITSDADLWVIRKERVVLPNHKEILITNADCCGKTSFKNVTFPIYPMCHVGMSVSNWRQMFPLKTSTSTKIAGSKLSISFPNERRFGFDRNYFQQADIQEFYNTQISNFGTRFYKQASHGDEHWDVDQRYMSYMLYLYQLKNGNHSIEYNRRFRN